MPRVSLFRLYLVTVIVTGIATIGYALVTESPASLVGEQPALFVAFAVLLLAAEARPVSWMRQKKGAVVTVGPSFNVALLFITGGLGAAVAAGALSAIGDVIARRGLLKAAFNSGMMTISIAVPGLILTHLSDRLTLVHGGPVTLQWMAVVVLALIAHNILNNTLVIAVVSLSEGLPVWPSLRRDLFRHIQTEAVLLALGPLMVLVAMRSILFLPVLLGITLMVLNTTRMALDRLHDATHDALTGLPNRRLFDEHLAEVLGGKSSKVVAVLLIDLDRFKEINDTLGHDIGDRVLIAVGERLQHAVPRSGLVARLGGDEFAILLTDVSGDADVLLGRGEAIHRAFTGSLEAENLPLTIGGSVGVALRRPGSSVGQLMRQADLAMYQAKSKGGGVVLHAQDPDGAVRTGRLALLDQLAPAIANGQLFLHYQPIITTETRQVVSLEALVRWRHPDLGLIPPSEFIPTAEQTDLIEPLTTFVLRQAMRDCKRFIELGHDVDVCVNLSSRSVTDLGFPRHLRQLLGEAALDPRRLTLELTENTILSDVDRAMQVLGEIRRLTVQVALDDFGTGYSSLTNLRTLPLTSVKIDRSFVTRMNDVIEDAAVVATVLQLAQQLGLQTVAEGIEDEEVIESLRRLGCDKLQGYHIARPLPFTDMVEWLDERRLPQATTVTTSTAPPTATTTTQEVASA